MNPARPTSGGSYVRDGDKLTLTETTRDAGHATPAKPAPKPQPAKAEQKKDS